MIVTIKSIFVYIRRNMKLNHVVLVLFVLLSLAVMAFAPLQAETPDPLVIPVEVQVFLTGAVIFIATAGLKALSQAFPNIPNLEGPTTVYAGATVTFIVTVGNALLTLVPPEYQPAVGAALVAIGSFLAANGYALLTKKKPATK